jgi:hypothetical protein
VKKHKNSTCALHYLQTFQKNPREHTSPFDKVAKSSLAEWFTFDGRFKPRIQNSIKRCIAFIMSQQWVTILEHRPKLKEELQSLLQNIKTSRQVLLGPIVQPIIHGFFEHKTLELLADSFKVTLPWV